VTEEAVTGKAVTGKAVTGKAVPHRDARGTPTIPMTHPGFLLSCAFGALGLLFLVVGLIIASQVLDVTGTFLGALSLFAALAWRSDLVTAWKRDHPKA
jgi:hypothetical protein